MTSQSEQRDLSANEASRPKSFDTNEDGNNSTALTPSPGRRARIAEMRTLSHLNDCFTLYINNVWQLESKNEGLVVSLKKLEEEGARELENSTSLFQSAIAKLNHLYEESLEKDQCLHDAFERRRTERDQLTSQVEWLCQEVTILEETLVELKARKNELQCSVDSVEAELKELEDEGKEADDEIVGLKCLTEQMLESLEEARPKNSSLSSQFEDATNAIECQKIASEKELEELSREFDAENNMIARSMECSYESLLQQQLQAMHIQFETRLNAARECIEETYNRKLEKVDESRQRIEKTSEESNRICAQIQQLEEQRSQQKALTIDLHEELTHSNAQLHCMDEECQKRLQQQNVRTEEMQEQIQQALSESNDLLALKVKLNTELETYESLLKGEESRLRSQRWSVERSGLEERGEGGDVAGSSDRSTHNRLEVRRFVTLDNDTQLSISAVLRNRAVKHS